MINARRNQTTETNRIILKTYSRRRIIICSILWSSSKIRVHTTHARIYYYNNNIIRFRVRWTFTIILTLLLLIYKSIYSYKICSIIYNIIVVLVPTHTVIYFGLSLNTRKVYICILIGGRFTELRKRSKNDRRESLYTYVL